MNHRPGLFIALAVLAAACEGTETGNPFVGEIRVHAHSSAPAMVIVGDDGSTTRVTGLWLASADLALLGDDCAAAVATVARPTDVDVATTIGENQVELDGATLCGAHLVLDPAAAPASAPVGFAGHTVWVEGTRADGTPFVVRSDLAGDLALPAVDARFVIEADAPAVFLGFDVAVWLGDVDLAGAVPDGDGVIVIDATTDPTRAAAFDDDVGRGIQLYRDVDRDGTVSSPDDVLLAQGQVVTP